MELSELIIFLENIESILRQFNNMGYYSERIINFGVSKDTPSLYDLATIQANVAAALLQSNTLESKENEQAKKNKEINESQNLSAEESTKIGKIEANQHTEENEEANKQKNINKILNTIHSGICQGS